MVCLKNDRTRLDTWGTRPSLPAFYNGGFQVYRKPADKDCNTKHYLESQKHNDLIFNDGILASQEMIHRISDTDGHIANYHIPYICFLLAHTHQYYHNSCRISGFKKLKDHLQNIILTLPYDNKDRKRKYYTLNNTTYNLMVYVHSLS